VGVDRVPIADVDPQQRVVIDSCVEAVAVCSAVVIKPSSAADLIHHGALLACFIGPHRATIGFENSRIDSFRIHLTFGEAVLQSHENGEDLKLRGIFLAVVIPTSAHKLTSVNSAKGCLREMYSGPWRLEIGWNLERYGTFAFGKRKRYPVSGVGVDLLWGRLEHCAGGE